MSEPPDSPSFTVQVSDEQTSVPVDGEWLRAVAGRAMAVLGVPAGTELSLSLVEPARIAELKLQALGIDEPTDVLAWPMDSVGDPPPVIIGDVVLCPAVAASQASDAGKETRDELAMLLVHGILHCLGRDHAEPDEERAMFSEQDRVLASIGEAVR